MDEEHYLRNVIEREVCIPKGREYAVSVTGEESNWIFDFRRVLMRPRVLRAVTKLFLKNFKDNLPFQIGGVEVAAIPLVTGMAMALSEDGYDVNAFFIRKSRKKSGLLRMVEGTLTDEKIIFVDDIINSGKSLIRQVEIAEALGKKVYAVFCFLRFREEKHYAYFHERGIKVISLFTLDDFKDSLGTFLRDEIKKAAIVPMPFSGEWYFKSDGADFFYVTSKSRPVLDEKRLYFGSDAGMLWALNQENGTIAWKKTVGFFAKGKYVFSSPAIHNGMLYVGAHDGNFYAFDTIDGKKRWMFAEADWVDSSPCVAEDIGLVVVGLEFGWWRKHGAVVGLNLRTGDKIWEYRVEGQVCGSPAYSKECRVVLCGANNATMYALDVRDGTLIWSFKTEGPIKGRPAVDARQDRAVFGSMDSYVYVVRLSDGKLMHKISANFGVPSDPLIHGGKVYVASLDKNLYCIDIASGNIDWKFYARSRIFSSPILAEGKIYIGSNDARFYEIDPHTGKETGFFQAVERITTAAAYNPKTKRFFVPTFANEIYCLERSHGGNLG